MLVFDHPWTLAAIALALLPFVKLRRRVVAGIAFPLDGLVLPKTLRQKLLWMPDTMRALTLALLAFGAAGPHWGAVRMTDETRGIAIELLVDRSSSMSLTDMKEGTAAGAPYIARLDVVKKLAKEFLTGNGADLKGRAGDAVGLIAFAAHPENLSPMVSHNEAALARSLDSIDFAKGREDATAIGDAISLAASRIRLAEQTRSISFRSKIIVLLTDGQENEGVRRLGDAAQLAARWNIRVYAIGIRPTREDDRREGEIGYGLDALAATTNGMAVMAADGAGVRKFFAAIDQLEPNTIPASGLSGGFDAASLALVLAFAMVCGETALRQTWMRVIP